MIESPIWHPCSQMKDYEVFKPLMVNKANGAYLELDNGKKVIDSISSWWCKSLGHNNPRLKKALLAQLDRFEHVILANTTNDVISDLSNKLAGLTQTLNKCFYASDGSCAVEIALKMSLHSRLISGEKDRGQFIALKNGFHGETTGALSVSDIGIYKTPYEKILFPVNFISEIPYVSDVNDPIWNDCALHWKIIEKSLEPFINITTALIIEPILQGAGGMKIYSQDFLKKLKLWTKKHNIHLIVDEIMTGFGRTGKMLACEYAGIEPDFLCLSKGLTAGWIPMSVVLTSDAIYDLFYDDYSTGKSFLHSHTFSGNALAASIAIEVMKIIEEDKLCSRADYIGKIMLEKMIMISDETQKLKNIRSIGALVATDLKCDDSNRRIGYEVYQRAVELGALLRPLGNTIYWFPPLNTELSVIEELASITKNAITSVKF
ncbi:MAG: adenosylmethionine--8-amino-7-oxononanoate transaminase [Gammaproteobacteria bacterium RIFCSPHIGHO2_12_FULL_37_14]|nr:MAG: adenosylmethionine--8-amino-7-oxononanoate transaminase [Gammaproteobacteria bacterium RIFCSPHIGHO2_12_FULL_37_14]